MFSRYTDALLKDAIETHYATATAAAAAGSKAAASAAAALSPPLVMDVGGNHGLFGLFAAALGAQVIMLEPQRALCEVRRSTSIHTRQDHDCFSSQP